MVHDTMGMTEVKCRGLWGRNGSYVGGAGVHSLEGEEEHV